MNDLKNCPFCGGEVGFRVSETEGHRSVYVVCTTCYASSDRWNQETSQEAMEVWNRRVDSPRTDTKPEDSQVLDQDQGTNQREKLWPYSR